MELDEARSLLGVSPTDEWEAVRIAYRRLIRQQHPDRAGPGATVRAAQLNDAYRVLSRALQVQTVDGIRPRRRLADPPPPRFDAHIEGADTLVVEAPRDEAFSQTAIIGLAHGVPVIGTEVDGFPATLGDGRGILVPPEDPQALAAALERVLHHELPRPLPLRHLAERYEPARVATIYESTYRGLVAPEAVAAQAVC